MERKHSSNVFVLGVWILVGLSISNAPTFAGTNNCCQPDGSCTFIGSCSVCPGPCSSVLTCDGLNCQPFGACCHPNGTCTDRDESDCRVDLGDTYAGDGTQCSSTTCPQPNSACCLSDGNCRFLTNQTACTSLSGTYLGEGTDCDPNPCAAGACCFAEQACTVVTLANCPGFFFGAGTSCDPANNPCDGACCSANGHCKETIETACGGVYQGDRTTCDPNPCPQPATGACCKVAELCTDGITDAECLFDFFAGRTCAELDLSTCDPLGACCASDGNCTLETASDCTNIGTYQSDFSVCDPNPCPQPPTGACCFPDGSCNVEPKVSCVGAGGGYQGDSTDCDPNNCPQPRIGACCFAAVGCSDGVIEPLCPFDFFANRRCDQLNVTTCSPLGACCLSDGECREEAADNCAALGGTYQGEFSVCDPNPCPQPTGACCGGGAATAGFAPGDCMVTTSANCGSLGGGYRGDGTECDPNPCSPLPTTGACCLAEAPTAGIGTGPVCVVLTQSECVSFTNDPSAYQGDGTSCEPNPVRRRRIAWTSARKAACWFIPRSS